MRLIRSNRGTSIVEVLVVMVVFLVGILTVVRLFPPGFKSVRHAESMTFASRLAQYEIERWKNNADNLPDGVLPIGLVGGTLQVLNDIYPGPPINDDNAGVFRRIIGETARIPFGGWSTRPESGSIYILSFSPIDVMTPGSILAVRGGDLSRRIVDSDNMIGQPPWDWLRPYQYAIDYDASKISFSSSESYRVFYLACSWWEYAGKGEPELRTATDIRAEIPVAKSHRWLTIGVRPNDDILIPVSPGATFIGLDRYSDTVSRGFAELQPQDRWSSDPYEYKLIDSVLGIISFNPLGYTQTEFGRSLEARIDYDILDSEIIREDRRVPVRDGSPSPTDPYRINLTLNRLKETNETINPDGTVYAGVNSYVPVDLLAIDLETCRQIDPGLITLNYKDGVVELNPDAYGLIRLLARPNSTRDSIAQVMPAGRNIRFFYKAEGDWSTQFHKIYSVFERSDSGALDYRTYTIDPNNQTRLVFAACNANQVVSVNYEYIDSVGRTKKVVGESHRTSDVLVKGGGVDRTYIDLKVKPEENETITRIFSVTGASAVARVIWRDSDRWRYVDLDTALVRRLAD
ncbi:MAG: hypothetical protein HYX78_13590 [Armatimonadetes bacterium]|nr:hypothetical protein [Armatimonadota bacterium]